MIPAGLVVFDWPVKGALRGGGGESGTDVDPTISRGAWLPGPKTSSKASKATIAIVCIESNLPSLPSLIGNPQP